MKRPQLADPLTLIRDGKLAEKSVPVCLALDLVAEFEELEREQRDTVREAEPSLSGGQATELARRMEDLRQQMNDHTVVFRLRALARPAFQALRRAHPVRQEDGKPHPEDQMLGVNRDTFFDPLLQASIVDPKLDEDTYRLLVDERLTDAQFELLTTIAWRLNVGTVDIPFSPAASALIRTSSDE